MKWFIYTYLRFHAAQDSHRQFTTQASTSLDLASVLSPKICNVLSIQHVALR